jgi:hypothetical protein
MQLSVFLAALDVTIVTTALPTIAEAFHSFADLLDLAPLFSLDKQHQQHPGAN